MNAKPREIQQSSVFPSVGSFGLANDADRRAGMGALRLGLRY